MAPENDSQDRRGSIHPDQMNAMLGAFASLSPLFLLDRVRRGAYVRDALSYRGITWEHGGNLSQLSYREAGFVLESLEASARGGVPHA